MENQEKLQKKNEKEAEAARKKAEKQAKKDAKKAQKAEDKKVKNEAKAEVRAEKKEKKASEEKTKSSGLQITVTVILAVLALAAVGFAYYLKTTPIKGLNPSAPNAVNADENVDSVVLTRKVTQIPLMPTDIPSVFYTADAAGNIVYYEFNGKDYAEIQPTGKYDFNMTISGQQIAVHIPYVERDGKLTGFGVYTADQHQENVFIYKFIMFKLQNMPSAYQKEGHCLLLMHTNQKQAYDLEPTWEQVYLLNRANLTTESFLSDHGQTLDETGGVRKTQYIVSALGLTSESERIPFCSSRGNEAGQDGILQEDIYVKNGRKDELVVSNVWDSYVKPLSKDSFAFIRRDEGRFSTMRYENGEEKLVATYNGNYGTNYMRSGDYILSKEDGIVYTTYGENSIATKDFKMNVQTFAVSPKQKYVAMAGTVTNALDYHIYIYNASTKNYALFDEKNYAEHRNMYFIDENTVCFYVPKMDAFENVVMDVSKIR